jgi:type VI secretion system secreted protein Hcp
MAVDMFLKLEGKSGAIEGESADDSHANEIEVLSWTWGMTQHGSGHSGQGSGAGKVNVGDIQITKYIDKSTPTIMKMCCKGDHIPTATLVVRKAGTNPVEYVKLVMKNCLVSGLTSGGTGGSDRLTENLSLNFSEFHYEYTPQDADQAGGASIPMGWNIAKNVEAS